MRIVAVMLIVCLVSRMFSFIGFAKIYEEKMVIFDDDFADGTSVTYSVNSSNAVTSELVTDEKYSGGFLMSKGIRINYNNCDFSSEFIKIEKI